jgi:hypothetical protein
MIEAPKILAVIERMKEILEKEMEENAGKGRRSKA